jgi:hypothetical protein
VIITAQAREVAGDTHGWKLVTPDGDTCTQEQTDVCLKRPVNDEVTWRENRITPIALVGGT